MKPQTVCWQCRFWHATPEDRTRAETQITRQQCRRFPKPEDTQSNYGCGEFKEAAGYMQCMACPNIMDVLYEHPFATSTTGYFMCKTCHDQFKEGTHKYSKPGDKTATGIKT